MTGDFNFTDYMKTVAENLKELHHTETERHFSRIKGISDLEEFLQNQRNLKGYQLAVVSSVSGRFVDSGDNMLDQPYYSFHLLKQVTKAGDYDALDAAIKECEVLAKKILSRMFKHRLEPQSHLNGLQRGSISYNQSGPWVHGWHGIMVSFTIYDYPGIIYNADDWIDG